MAAEDLLSREQCKHAVESLIALNAAKGPGLLDASDDKKIYLQMSFKKAPLMKPKTIKLNLPFALSTPATEVCLFVKDSDKRDKDFTSTVTHYKDLLIKQNVKCVNQVIPLKSLKLEYRPYEAKRNLANMFDVHLADERIMHLLPSILGKNFYHKKKQPFPVNLKAVNLKKEIEGTIGSSRCILTGRGSCCAAAVGLSSMTVQQVVDNILAAVKALIAGIPGGSANIKTLHIRQLDSAALPIYVSLSSGDDVILPDRKQRCAESEPEEITTLTSGKVKVSRMGNVTVVPESNGEPDDGSKEVVAERRRSRKRGSASGKGPRPKVAKKAAGAHAQLPKAAQKQNASKSRPAKDRKQKSKGLSDGKSILKKLAKSPESDTTRAARTTIQKA